MRASAARASLPAGYPIAGARLVVALPSQPHARAAPSTGAAPSPPSRRRSAVAAAAPARAPAASRSPSSPPSTEAVDLAREAHKVFDEAYITARGGKGGAGEVVEAGRGKWVRNLKYRPGGQQAKKVWMPASEPADGADGADVVLVCDASCDSLLHLHQPRKGGKGTGSSTSTPSSAPPAATSRQPRVFAGADGAHGNPAVGSAGPKRNRDIKKARTPPLEVPVPPGTVVRRKGNGAVVGELLNPGDRLVVARGGRGGAGVVAPSREAKQRDTRRELRRAEQAGAEVVGVEDGNWRADARGLPGTTSTLQLLLRVVADVGIVGLPNAGKSSLLAALTRAAPEVAPYPFTTLMPNLGVMLSAGHQGGGDGFGAEDDEDDEDLEAERARERQLWSLLSGGDDNGAGAPPALPSSASATAAAPVLADLPGLIEGAHSGRGLGRAFLRHLRRARALLHVVDASAEDPAADYSVVREELRMYNPAYVSRPHVVALNKCDLEVARKGRRGAAGEVAAAAARLRKRAREEGVGVGGDGGNGGDGSGNVAEPTLPAAVVAVSASSGEGVRELRAALQKVLADEEREAAAKAATAGKRGGRRQQPEAEQPRRGVIFVDGVVEDEDDEGDEEEEEQPPHEGQDDEGEEEEGDGDGDAAAAASASPDDEDAWMLALSDAELLALAGAGDEDGEESEDGIALEGDDDGGWGDDDDDFEEEDLQKR
jgi:GTPase involved in cell partitioning and DNA repair